jgi:predicted ATPase
MIKNNSHRIVLTGGPGGGKTTALDLIRRELGEKVVVVPETATILFTGGFPRRNEAEACRSAQKAIYHVQKNMEDIQHSVYPDRILLCDRGTLDGAAYWPDGESSFYNEVHTEFENELARYDAVLFFETAAVGNISIEGGNPVRTEDNRRAVELNNRLKTVWSKHHNFVHIEHQKSFFAKLQNAINCIDKIIQTLDEKQKNNS